MGEGREHELIREALAGMSRGEVPAEVFHPDAEIVPLRAALEGTSYRGRDAPARFIAEIQASWKELTVEEREFAMAGDTALVTCRMHAVGQTGATADTDVGIVVRFADGLIVSVRAYADPAEARRAAGL